MKIKWEIDQFSGGDTYTVDVPDEDLAACDSAEDAETLINDYVEDDARQKAIPVWERADYEAEIEKLIRARKRKERSTK